MLVVVLNDCVMEMNETPAASKASTSLAKSASEMTPIEERMALRFREVVGSGLPGLRPR